MATNAVSAKKLRANDDKERKAKNSMNASAASNDRQALYDSVLNSKDDESELRTTRSGDEDEFVVELVKEYVKEKLQSAFKRKRFRSLDLTRFV